MFRIFLRTEAPVQPANVVQERKSNVKGLPSTTTENKSLNSSIERRDETQKRGSDQMGKYNPSSNENTNWPKKRRFELVENDSEFSWYLEESMADYANKRIENFFSDQVLQKGNKMF